LWLDILRITKTVFTLADEANRHTSEIKDLRSELKVLTLSIVELKNEVAELRHEVRRADERSEHEREKILLELENRILRFERDNPTARAKITPKQLSGKSARGGKKSASK
jgi:chromosome segregation ATPase